MHDLMMWDTSCAYLTKLRRQVQAAGDVTRCVEGSYTTQADSEYIMPEHSYLRVILLPPYDDGQDVSSDSST